LLEEALALHEHAARAAGGVVDGAAGRGEQGDEQADDARRGVKLAAVATLGGGEAGEEVLVDAAEDVERLAALSAEVGDVVEQVEELAEAGRVEPGALVDLGQDPAQGRVLGLDRGHGLIELVAEQRRAAL